MKYNYIKKFYIKYTAIFLIDHQHYEIINKKIMNKFNCNIFLVTIEEHDYDVDEIVNLIKEQLKNNNITEFDVSIFSFFNTTELLIKLSNNLGKILNLFLILPTLDNTKESLKDKNIFLFSGENELNILDVEKFYNNNKDNNKILYLKSNNILRGEALLQSSVRDIIEKIEKELSKNKFGEYYIGEKIDSNVVFITEGDKLLTPHFKNKVIYLKKEKNYVPYSYLSFISLLEAIKENSENKIVYVPNINNNFYLTNEELNNDNVYLYYDENNVEKIGDDFLLKNKENTYLCNSDYLFSNYKYYNYFLSTNIYRSILPKTDKYKEEAIKYIKVIDKNLALTLNREYITIKKDNKNRKFNFCYNNGYKLNEKAVKNIIKYEENLIKENFLKTFTTEWLIPNFLLNIEDISIKNNNVF